ncbi:MAG: anaerobic ribonucleoside-triphosphate reductase activating protein, partial [Clostridia bacterium]|nr:anaerobic ribonucleoside-triphosphate reductase activating protein [Clostridia bacterium]
LMEKIKHSVEILRSGRVEYEFRTTLTREMHSAEDIMAIGRWLCGESRYFLQTYRDEGELVEGGYTPYSREETAELLQIVRSYLPNAEIRFS